MLKSDKLKRNVSIPLYRAMLAPLEPECKYIQFDAALPDQIYRAMAKLLSRRPDVCLRVYGGWNKTVTDLRFLRFFPCVKRFCFDLFELSDWTGLEYLPDDLEYLGIGETRDETKSLAFVARFIKLKSLHLERHTKHLDSITACSELEEVTLKYITLPDLSLLNKLPFLRSLALQLGGTKCLTGLNEIANLRYLQLAHIKGIEDLSLISQCTKLQWMHLESLRWVTAIPCLSNLHSLRQVVLINMKGITDLSPFCEAKDLESLFIFEARHMVPEQFCCLATHPALKCVCASLGSIRKDNAVEELLPFEHRGNHAEFVFR